MKKLGTNQVSLNDKNNININTKTKGTGQIGQVLKTSVMTL